MNKEKKYINEYPNLMKEWNWEKNNELRLYPDKLLHKSNKNVWWKCAKNHSWKDSIYHRVDGRNCPYCSNRRVLVGFNDLQTTHPQLADEWNYAKNVNLKPTEMVAGSSKKVYWICLKCGHEWQMQVQYRTKNETGCPICDKEKVSEKRRKVIVQKRGGIKNRRLREEWNYEKNNPFTPDDFTEGSNMLVWWRCSSCGYEWESKIANRRNGRNCPYCSNKVVVKGKNDLQTTHPDLSKEWNYEKNYPLTPYEVSKGGGKKVWWTCPNGHDYQATVNHRTTGTNCPVCNSGRQTSFAEQAIYYYVKKYFPDAQNKVNNVFGTRMEFDIYIPSINVVIEYDGAYWHEKEKSKKKEQKKFDLCQKNGIMLIRVREPEDNSFNQTNYTHIHGGAIGDSRLTTNYVIFSDKTGRNRTLNSVITEIFKVLQDISKWYFPFQKKLFIQEGVIDIDRDKNEIYKNLNIQYSKSLLVENPSLAQEWHPLKNLEKTPSQVSANTNQKVWWQCKICGYEWEASIAKRRSGTGCPQCAIDKNSKKKRKPIYQYTLEGVFLKKWDSLSIAGKELKINISNISMAANHQRANAGGFRWDYVYYEKLQPMVEYVEN